MDQETIQLILDMGASGANVESVRAKLEGLKGSVQATAGTYEVLDTVVAKSVGTAGTYDVAIQKTNVELAREQAQLEAVRRAMEAYNGELDAQADAQVRAALESTQAQKAMQAVLAETAQQTAEAADGFGKLRGTKSQGGIGILSASYAVQDFMSVMQNGGGLGRALGSISNNIPSILMGLGAGAGLTGVISALAVGAIAAVPAIEKWWGVIDSDAAEAAKKKIEKIRAEIEATNKEFAKLQGAPTDAEKESAEGIGLFLKGRGNADRARAAVEASVTGAEAAGKMADPKAYRALEGDATATDAQLDTEARVEAARTLGANGDPESIRAAAAGMMPGLRERRATAQREREGMLRAARRAKAEEVVTGATKAGPEGEAARKKLLGVAAATPGLTDLLEMSPERVAAANAADDADEGPGSEAFAERARAGVRSHRKADRKAAEKFRQEGGAAPFGMGGAAASALTAAGKQAARDDKELEAKVKADQDLGHRVGKAATKHEKTDVGHPLQKIPLMDVDPIMAAGGPQAVGHMQQQIYQQTGMAVPAERVAQQMIQEMHRLQQARANFLDATVQMSRGVDEEITQLRHATRSIHRGGVRPVTGSQY